MLDYYAVIPMCEVLCRLQGERTERQVARFGVATGVQPTRNVNTFFFGGSGVGVVRAEIMSAYALGSGNLVPQLFF